MRAHRDNIGICVEIKAAEARETEYIGQDLDGEIVDRA